MAASLLANPRPITHSFHFTAGRGAVVEVRPKSSLADLVTAFLADDVGALVELEFEAGTGSFEGFRLQNYHDVGQQTPPADIPETLGAPGLTKPASSLRLATGRLVCSKHMTAIDRGNLFLNWSGALTFERTSIFQLKSPNGFAQGSLRFYYHLGELVALRLEAVPITIFNELPHFTAPGR
jgi:hypothetical protein